MLTKTELKKYMNITGFDLWQTEKDYLQHLFLIFLSRRSKDQLVFKGGTALQKIYGLNRFSSDLDFTMKKKMDDEIIEKISRDVKLFGFDCKFKKIKSYPSLVFKLMIKGPLFDGSNLSISSLRLEINKKDEVLLEPEIKEVYPIYNDLQPYTCLVMDLREILAEKIRAILTRQKARDVYDLWFLLKKNVDVDINLINKKLEFYNKRFNKKEFISQLKKMEKIWSVELKPLLNFIPPFQNVFDKIVDKLK